MSVVLSIFQDSYGFMWFGSVKGLNRYDGLHVSVFTSENYPENTLSAGAITGIDEGDSGKLYITVYGGGLNIYDLQTGMFKYFRQKDVPGSLIDDRLNDVLCINSETVWLAADNGLTKFNSGAGTFTNITCEEIFGDTTDARILSLHADDGVLWLGSHGKGLVKYTPASGSFNTFTNNHKAGKDFVKKNIVRAITDFGEDKLLVATEEGLWIFDKIKEQFVRPLVEDHSFYEIAEDGKGHYWVTSFYNGLFRIDDKGNVENLRYDPFDLHSFPADDLFGAYYRNGYVWFGTLSDGVVQLCLDHKAFTHVYYVPGKPGLPSKSVFSLDEDEDGKVWIGTPKGAAVWNRRDNSFERVRFSFDGKNTPSVPVWNFFMEGDVVWLCTPEGLIRHDRKTGRQQIFRNDPHDGQSLVHNHVNFTMRDKKGNLWVATRNGVSRMSADGKTFKNYVADGKKNSLANSLVWQIFQDSKGRLWFVTASGICMYNYEKDDFRTFTLPESDAGISGVMNPLLMTEASDGRCWIGTNTGILVFEDEETSKYIGAADGLPDLYIYKFLEAEDAMWVSTNNGIAVIDKKTLKVIDKYSADDGLQSNEFNPAAKKLHDGYFVFGGVNGITGFYPDSIRRSDYTPKIYFTGLSVQGKDVTSGNTGSEKPINSGKNISILNLKKIYFEYEEKMFSFSFAALDYSNPRGINYFYRLLPSSQEWISLGNKNYVNFVNLSPGDYRLEVKSTNADGILCDNVAYIDIVVMPPFWKTGWFVFLEVLLIGLLIFGLLKLRTYHLNREKRKLEKEVAVRTSEIKKKSEQIEKQNEKLQRFASDLEVKVKERTAELEAAKRKAEEADMLKSAFLSNMSHEIRTPMNAIMGFSELLITPGFNEEEKKTFANMVKSNGDALLTLLNDIIDISMIESGQLKLSLGKVKLYDLADNVFRTFSNSVMMQEKKGHVDLILNVKDEFRDVVIRTDSHRLIQILNNLVGNALKFTQKGYVEFGYEIKDGEVEFFVKDTGIGIDEKSQKTVFRRFYKMQNKKSNFYPGNGLGLTITKNLVEALHGRIWVESKPGKGSVFRFTISV